MAQNLVIVESPAKAGTIQKYLGKDFTVLASYGHIRDLPKSKLSVDVDSGFTPSYAVPLKAKAQLKKLKDALKGVSTVYLATDLDREGEAIAWHVAEALDLSKQKGLTVHRITFDEITERAIKDAVAHPRSVNMQLVDAQQARRVLDRLVGYTLSPVLWKKVMPRLSAGRVQSVALRLIAEREEERMAFVPQAYWSIAAQFALAEGEVNAKLVKFSGEKIEQLTIASEEKANTIVSSLEKGGFTVQAVDVKETSRKPVAPYTTASFQQDAVNRLGLSAKSGMRAAQSLYEAGHITYMRTDSVELASEAIEAIRSFVTSEYGPEYLPEKPNTYTAKAKNAQEAHEAIRPTAPGKSANLLKLESIEAKVYELIRSRAMASQMMPARFEQTAITIVNAEAELRATGTRTLFPGYQAAMPQRDDEVQELPKVSPGENAKLIKVAAEGHETEPPARFTEASLIKSLEEHGIGRPSTYAPTIDTLIGRRYVLKEGRALIPEKVGMAVTGLLREHFPDIVDLNFTATMEEELDDIAEGTATYLDTLTKFWKPFHTQVEEKTAKIERVDMTEPSDELCPLCNAPMIIRVGRFGRFLSCTRFPECKGIKSLSEVKPSGLICPRDGKELAWKKAKRGLFLGCSGYPACDFACWKADKLLEKISELETAGETLEFKTQAIEAFHALPTPDKE